MVISTPLDVIVREFPAIILRRWSDMAAPDAIERWTEVIIERWGTEPVGSEVRERLHLGYTLDRIRRGAALHPPPQPEPAARIETEAEAAEAEAHAGTEPQVHLRKLSPTRGRRIVGKRIRSGLTEYVCAWGAPVVLGSSCNRRYPIPPPSPPKVLRRDRG